MKYNQIQLHTTMLIKNYEIRLTSKSYMPSNIIIQIALIEIRIIQNKWENIDHLINKNSKSTNISSLRVDKEVIVESASMSNLFNEYFTNIGSTLSG